MTGPDGTETGLTAARGTSPEPAPPDFANGGGRLESATRTSLWVAAGLMLLAALAGFATPSLRDRVREGPRGRTSVTGRFHAALQSAAPA